MISLDNGPVGIGLKNSAALSQIRMVYDDKITGKDIFPPGKYDVDLQQVDLRTMNTWRMTLAEVTPSTNAVFPRRTSHRPSNRARTSAESKMRWPGS